MNDWNASDSVLVAAFLIALASVAQCDMRVRQGQAEVDKVRAQSGLCADKWGTWSKCK